MNSNYQNDINNSLKYCRIFLRLIGMWPLINGFNSRIEKLTSTLLIPVSIISMIIVIFPGGYSIFYVSELKLKIQILGPICYGLACIIKYCCFGAKASAIKYCIEQIKEDWKFIEDEEHRAIMMEYMAIAHKSIAIYSAQLYFSGLSYCIILPHWSDSIHIAENATYTLVYPGLDFIMEDIVARNYKYLYLIHCVFGFVSVNIENSLCGIVLSFVAHTCGMFQIQVARLQHLVDGTKNKDKDLLSIIIHEHTEVLRHAEDVSKALQEIFFFDILTTTIAICALEYLCVLAWKSDDLVGVGTYGTACLSLGFNMFLICYVGEILLEEGEKFGDATYNIKWYDLPQNKKLDLVLVIAISKFPPKLTGGKIFEISVNTFSTVLKSSFAYLNLCLAITE